MKLPILVTILFAAVWMKRGHNPLWPALRFLCRASHFLLAACIMAAWAARDTVRFIRRHWAEAEIEATRVANAKPEEVTRAEA